MKFRLIYEGQIKPRNSATLADIHAIRCALHPQLRKLWEFSPWAENTNWLKLPSKPGEYEILEQRGDRIFAPLISVRNDLQAELDILFLRQQPSGNLVGQGGDLDNRLKTLFDALRIPTVAELNTLGETKTSSEDPLHCLLQDDHLITAVSVETDRFLRPANKNDVLAVIHVNIRATRVTWGTISLLG